MKFINKLLVLTVLILGFSACDVTDLDIQDNPNAVTPENAGVDFLYTNVQLAFGGFFQGMDAFTGRTSRLTAMTAGNTYANSYQAVNFNGLWYNAYANLFPDVDALLTLTSERGLDIHGGSAKIMKAYVMLSLVDIFGDVPYSEAGQGTDIISPRADSGSDVYDAALALLDEAIRDLDGTVAAGPADDLIYGGDADKWIAAANSLKLKAYLNTGNSAGFTATLAENIIDDASEDLVLQYGNSRSNPNSRHPWYNDSYEASDGDYQSNWYMWLLQNEKGIEDPRLRFYFFRQDLNMEDEDPNGWSCVLTETPFDPVSIPHWDNITEPHWADSEWELPYCITSANGYAGRDHGNGSGIPPDGAFRTVYGLYPAGGNFDYNQGGFSQNEGTDGALGEGISPVMLSSFVNFMRAEAAITMGTGEDARALLEQAIREQMGTVRSFETFLNTTTVVGTDPMTMEDILLGEAYLDPLDDDIDAYIAVVLDRFDTAPSSDDELNTVITEYFIALFGNGIEAYNAYRRTSFPKGIAPGLEPGIGSFPRSALYPADYVNLNANATQKADTGVQVFWDDNPADGWVY